MPAEEKILLIDDDKIVRASIIGGLDANYATLEAKEGIEGLALAASEYPSVILLDVNMPGLNGFEVCQKLKSSPDTLDIPVMFLTSAASIDEKMKGYEAGADDFLVKPSTPDEIDAKLKVLMRRRHNAQALAARADQATTTALSVMAGNNELGMAIQFVEKSHSVRSYDSLGMALMSVLNSLGLHAVAYFSTHKQAMYYSTEGLASPLEQDLITMLHCEGSRFRDFGARTQTNYPHVALLVKNMPLEDMDRYGRLKDLFPSLLGAADAKVIALDTEHALLTQTDSLVASFGQVKDTLDNLGRGFEENQQEVIEVMRKMLAELDFKLPSMGLEDDQELYLIKRVDLAVQESVALMDQSENLLSAFHNITRLLEHLATQQQRIADNVISVDDGEEQQDDTDVNDIELF